VRLGAVLVEDDVERTLLGPHRAGAWAGTRGRRQLVQPAALEFEGGVPAAPLAGRVVGFDSTAEVLIAFRCLWCPADL